MYPLRIYGLEERSATVFLKCLACRCDMVVRGGDGGRENCDTVRIYSLSTSYNNNGVRIYSGTSHNNGGRPCFLGPTLLEVYRFHMCQQILQYNIYQLYHVMQLFISNIYEFQDSHMSDPSRCWQSTEQHLHARCQLTRVPTQDACWSYAGHLEVTNYLLLLCNILLCTSPKLSQSSANNSALILTG